jgi:hypothetical protein
MENQYRGKESDKDTKWIKEKKTVFSSKSLMGNAVVVKIQINSKHHHESFRCHGKLAPEIVRACYQLHTKCYSTSFSQDYIHR